MNNTDPLPNHDPVLVVDDHEMVRNLVVRVLESAGLTVIAVDSGPAAIELVQERPDYFGCVLQDLSMPKMRGEKVIARMYEVRPDLPIVAFTAEDEFSAAERLAGLNVAGIVQKPFEISAMIEMILRLTATKSAGGNETS